MTKQPNGIIINYYLLKIYSKIIGKINNYTQIMPRVIMIN